MKRLLLPLLAALVLPTAVNAETWHLLVKVGEGRQGRSYAWQVPTSSQEECNEQKSIVVKSEEWTQWKGANFQDISAICIKGK